ncbi:glycoside hydrolase family 43 protein [Piedraia hortae CBS 480.64]|uniref:Glycoside hydrolase family 43 protein n=1 Tax=Piedraia hortae CBS 480.64 TaxID=1314780 RepID=A0A6A7C2W3_9PEZI|nr:glycoside hydrolase family 43 protein [Piedraia hortae CBS 480.64]
MLDHLIIAAAAVLFCSAAPLPPPHFITGPVANGTNFPDPSIINDGKNWYSFATRTKGSYIHIQVARSHDFKTWEVLPIDALPNLPRWVDQSGDSATWAPDVSRLDNGKYIMYYSARIVNDTTKHCTGAATSTSITGPYIPTDENEPLICPLSAGGAIDASGFKDPDTKQRYIVYKVDGNSIGHGGACGNDVAPYIPTPLTLQPVSTDGLTFTGPAITLIDNAGSSDEGVLEAPSLTKSRGRYYLFYSSGCFTTDRYQVNYAVSENLTSGWKKAAEPLLQTGVSGLRAPGGADLDPDGKHFVFHAGEVGARGMYTARVELRGEYVSFRRGY